MVHIAVIAVAQYVARVVPVVHVDHVAVHSVVHVADRAAAHTADLAAPVLKHVRSHAVLSALFYLAVEFGSF